MVEAADITPDFAFYRDRFGGALGQAEFERHARAAAFEVASRLRPRTPVQDVRERAWLAVCEVSEADAGVSARVSSYTAGKVSETYAEGQGTDATLEGVMRRYLRPWLKGGMWL